LFEGDIVFSRVGSVDRRAYVSDKEEGWLFSGRLLRVRANKKVIYPKYLSYFFGQERFKEHIRRIAVGATMPSINTSILSNVDISFPPLPEQRAIAGVLSSLDDKIDLLHRENEILEALAETLFRQWFIEEAEDDWEEKPLDEIAVFLNGLACQKFPPKNDRDKLPVLKIKELRGGVSDQSDWASTDISEEYIVRNGDIIFSWSGSLLLKIWDGQDCILNQHLFRVTPNNFPKWFVYFWIQNHLRKFILIAESKSTTMGHIKRSDLSNSEVLIPSRDELSEMDENVSPFFQKIINNNQQISVLESLRDLLLPKLMNGEVRLTL
jgi:type I restriction enzyme S subunit